MQRMKKSLLSRLPFKWFLQSPAGVHPCEGDLQIGAHETSGRRELVEGGGVRNCREQCQMGRHLTPASVAHSSGPSVESPRPY